MLTSHCQVCGALKAPDHYANDYCADCESTRKETREFVTRENEERNAHNAAILTDEVKDRLRKAAEDDMTGSVARELERSLDLKPLIDMSAALRDAMNRRVHNIHAGHADSRSVFNPGLKDTKVNGLGMDSKVPPGRTLVPFPPR